MATVRAIIAASVLCLAWVSPAAAQLRVVNYNIAQLNGNQPALEAVIAALNADDKNGWAVPVSVFIFQEVQSGDRVPLLNLVNANAPPGVTYSQATYTTSGLEDSSAGAQLLLYRTGLLTEITTSHADIATGNNRNADRWQLRLLFAPGVPWSPTPDANSTFYVYSMHLAAENNAPDAATRAAAVTTIRNNAAALGAAAHIIYAGDMNFYTNTETGYTNWFTAGTSQATDPLGTGSWAGAGNAFKHTQSPCNAGCFGVGGGLDDRFDFQLHNAQFNDFDGLQRIAGVYRAFGNDGNHHNQDINNGNNTYYPGDIPRSNTLATDLRAASDHIPVICEYRLPAAMGATLDENFGRVIQNATGVTVDLTVTNISPVTVSVGADLLDYTFAGGDSLGLNAGGSSLAALAAPGVHALDVDTSVVGSGYGWIDLNSSSEGCRDASQFLETDGTIVRPSNASFSNSSDINDTQVEVNLDADTGVQAIDVPVHNVGFDALQALLDVDSVSAVAPPFAYTGGAAMNIGSTPATLHFTFDTAATIPGLYTQNVTIDVSDEDIPGAVNGQLTLSLKVTIDGGRKPCLGDVAPFGKPDGIVDINDYTDVILAWGTAGPQGDTDDDGDVDIDDYTNVVLNWGCSE